MLYFPKKLARDNLAREEFRKEKKKGSVLTEKYILDIIYDTVDAGADAIIVQDMAVIEMARRGIGEKFRKLRIQCHGKVSPCYSPAFFLAGKQQESQ